MGGGRGGGKSIASNYYFMVIQEKDFRSRIRNYFMFQNILFLAWENLYKPLKIMPILKKKNKSSSDEMNFWTP